MTRLSISSGPGVELEARWDAPSHPSHAVVLCHPHPLHGGTMNAPLMVAVTKALVDLGIAVLRFNFRGVGASTGLHDRGEGEQNDLQAAVAEAARSHPGISLAVAGWSFGAATALAWQARAGSSLPYAGIAPPMSDGRFPFLPGAGDLAPAPRRIIIGDRDQFTTVPEAEAYAATVGAELVVIDGSDHFFYFREQRVADLIAGLVGAISPTGSGEPGHRAD